jgi:hypothetical protein
MASAHYFFRNYDIKQVINLVCYMTEYPHTLTSTQKITRLYRYPLPHIAVSCAGRRSGPSARIGAIQPTIIATSASPGSDCRPCSAYPRALPSLERRSTTSKSE